MRAVEAGVDFDAMEAVGVALEVGEFGVAGGWEGGGVVLGEGPAGGADVDVVECGRVGRSGFHMGARVGVWRIRRILRRVPQLAVEMAGMSGRRSCYGEEFAGQAGRDSGDEWI